MDKARAPGAADTVSVLRKANEFSDSHLQCCSANSWDMVTHCLALILTFKHSPLFLNTNTFPSYCVFLFHWVIRIELLLLASPKSSHLPPLYPLLCLPSLYSGAPAPSSTGHRPPLHLLKGITPVSWTKFSPQVDWSHKHIHIRTIAIAPYKLEKKTPPLIPHLLSATGSFLSSPLHANTLKEQSSSASICSWTRSIYPRPFHRTTSCEVTNNHPLPRSNYLFLACILLHFSGAFDTAVIPFKKHFSSLGFQPTSSRVLFFCVAVRFLWVSLAPLRHRWGQNLRGRHPQFTFSLTEPN